MMAYAGYLCCDSALQSLFQAITIRANQSRSIFLELAEAQNCSNTFQNLHRRTNLSKCQLQQYISSSKPTPCSKDVASVINILGVERYNTIRSNCKELSASNYSDDTCFNCVTSYRQSLQILKENDNSLNGKGCAEALLVSLASSDIQSFNWVHGTFSCLWNEIESPWPATNHNKGSIWGSKKLLAAIIMAAVLVIMAPILYKVTKKQLQYASKKDIEDLSVIVLQKTLEDESRRPFNCSDLYLFSKDEMEKATNSFDSSNLIGEGTLGKTYVGIMPSGMRAAVIRIHKNIKHDLVQEMCQKSKIRHTNLVSTLGCSSDDEDQCLVYEYCVNGDLSKWIFGDKKTLILTWEHRKQISVGIARGLWFLHNNPLEKMVHGDIKLKNILLNEKLAPKITDSILSNCKLKHGIRTETNKTFSDDVFNFGVVLLQILTGRKPKSLVMEAREIILKGGSVNAMADPSLNGAYVSTEFYSLFSLAVLCTTPNDRERPNMEEIVKKLKGTLSLV